MPKVYLKETDKILNRIKEFIIGRAKRLNLTQTQIANELGITQQCYSKKLKRLSFSCGELVELLNVLEVSEEDINRLLERRNKCIS